MSEIIDDAPREFVGSRNWVCVHYFSGSRIDGLAVTLEDGLTRYTEHVADLLPRSACLSCVLNSRGQQRLSPVLNLVCCPHPFERIVVAAQDRGGEDLAELAMKLLTRRGEHISHVSMMA
jgi:hypothetical protein